jgi:hypothetical protein
VFINHNRILSEVAQIVFERWSKLSGFQTNRKCFFLLFKHSNYKRHDNTLVLVWEIVIHIYEVIYIKKIQKKYVTSSWYTETLKNVLFLDRSYQVLLTDVVIIPKWAIQAPLV